LGKPFTLTVKLLSSGKRGRYVLGAYFIEGWDAGRKKIIASSDPIPDKPWLACTHTKITSRGRGLYDEKRSISLVVTHHALSRLAQRCGAQSTGDLLVAVHNIWWAHIKECCDRKDSGHRIKADRRLKFKLTESLSAFAVLKPYDDGRGGIIVATILDTSR
jgi:hypothetical protein